MITRLTALLLLATLLLTGVSCTGGQTPTDTHPESDTDPAEEITPPADTQPETESATQPPETESAAPETEPPAELDKSQAYKILFIGNSYTYANDMPSNYFNAIMRAAGYKVKIYSITRGGWTLLASSDPSDEVGKQVDTTLKKQDFAFVILQEQSTTPGWNRDAFYRGVEALNGKIRAGSGTPVLYATWGRKAGSGDLDYFGWTDETMTWKLAASYATIGQELDIPVAHVGLAFWDVTVNHPDVNLYSSDLSHPSRAGSYLAALTIFARVTGIDPTTVDYESGLGAEVDALLKETARKAVFETPEIPEKYMAEAERQG